MNKSHKRSLHLNMLHAFMSLLLLSLFTVDSITSQNIKLEQNENLLNIRLDDYSDYTLKQFIEDNQNILLLFYSPYCKYSNSLIKNLKEALSIINEFNYFTNCNNTNSNVNYINNNNNNDNCLSMKVSFALINIFEQKELSKNLNKNKQVESTPLIKHLINGKLMSIYEGSRSTYSLINYIHGIIYPDNYIINLTNKQEYTKFSLLIHSFLFVTTEDEYKTANNLVKNSQDSEEIIYAYTTYTNWLTNSNEKEIIRIFNEYKNTLNPKFGVFKSSVDEFKYIDMNEGMKVIENKINDDTRERSKIDKFIFKHSYSNILFLNEETVKYIFSYNKPALFFYSSPKKHDFYYKILEKNLHYTNIRDKVLVYLLGLEGNELYEGRFFSLVKADYKDFPSIKIHVNNKELETYSMNIDLNNNNINFKEIENFVDMWYNNKLIKDKKEQNKSSKDDL